jgi:hypothetical protein
MTVRLIPKPLRSSAGRENAPADRPSATFVLGLCIDLGFRAHHLAEPMRVCFIEPRITAKTPPAAEPNETHHSRIRILGRNPRGEGSVSENLSRCTVWPKYRLMV